MFGTYYCDDCDRTWMSGNSWKGVGQQCRECGTMYLPHTLDPPQRSRSFEPGRSKPPHQQDLCGKCEELGYNCETYVPPDTEVATKDEILSDDEDSTSIISTNSSDSNDSTLVPSSEADNNDDSDDNSTSSSQADSNCDTPVNTSTDEDDSDKDDQHSITTEK